MCGQRKVGRREEGKKKERERSDPSLSAAASYNNRLVRGALPPPAPAPRLHSGSGKSNNVKSLGADLSRLFDAAPDY